MDANTPLALCEQALLNLPFWKVAFAVVLFSILSGFVGGLTKATLAGFFEGRREAARRNIANRNTRYGRA